MNENTGMIVRIELSNIAKRTIKLKQFEKERFERLRVVRGIFAIIHIQRHFRRRRRRRYPHLRIKKAERVKQAIENAKNVFKGKLLSQ